MIGHKLDTLVKASSECVNDEETPAQQPLGERDGEERLETLYRIAPCGAFAVDAPRRITMKVVVLSQIDVVPDYHDYTAYYATW